MSLKKGDVFRNELPGGGGWGDPLDRDPDRVLMDVRNEFVSIDSAASDYGVIIDSTNWRVDDQATQRLRERRRSERAPELISTLVGSAVKQP